MIEQIKTWLPFFATLGLFPKIILTVFIISLCALFLVALWTPSNIITTEANNAVSKNNLSVWIWYYPDSSLPEGKSAYIKNKQSAHDLKNALFDHGFHNVFITSKPNKEQKTTINYVNGVSESVLSEINNIVSKKQLPVNQDSAFLVKKPKESVGYEHQAVSINLGFLEF